MDASITKDTRILEKQMRAKGRGIRAFAPCLLAACLYSSCGSAQVSIQYPFCLKVTTIRAGATVHSQVFSNANTPPPSCMRSGVQTPLGLEVRS